MSEKPETVLPAHSSEFERALEQASFWVIETSDLVDVWNPQTCPPEFLPWLAWSLSVDDWNHEWPEQIRRSAIEASISIHRKKGTLGAVRKAIEAFGYGDAVIVEGFEGFSYDGEITYDGSEVYGEPDHWAEYRVFLERPISIEQANELRSILGNVAPARCHLKGLYFTEVANIYNGAITYDGAFTYGVVQ